MSCDDSALLAIQAAALEVGVTVRTGPVVSLATVVWRAVDKQDLSRLTSAIAVDMESAAVGDAARAHGVPFHAVAPWSTVDLACPSGEAIPIEQRAAEEVYGARGIRWASADASTFNPAFDVTPAALVTSLITERGVVEGEQLAAGGLARLG